MGIARNTLDSCGSKVCHYKLWGGWDWTWLQSKPGIPEATACVGGHPGLDIVSNSLKHRKRHFMAVLSHFVHAFEPVPFPVEFDAAGGEVSISGSMRDLHLLAGALISFETLSFSACTPPWPQPGWLKEWVLMGGSMLGTCVKGATGGIRS